MAEIENEIVSIICTLYIITIIRKGNTSLTMPHWTVMWSNLNNIFVFFWVSFIYYLNCFIYVCFHMAKFVLFIVWRRILQTYAFHLISKANTFNRNVVQTNFTSFSSYFFLSFLRRSFFFYHFHLFMAFLFRMLLVCNVFLWHGLCTVSFFRFLLLVALRGISRKKGKFSILNCIVVKACVCCSQSLTSNQM